MNKPSVIKGTAAYFISPDGEIIYVPTSHIATVIENPDMFDLTSDEIEASYQRFDEPLGLEGKARHEILTRIIEAGWIRLRRNPNQHWAITTHDLSVNTNARLLKWKQDLLSGELGLREADPQMPAIITRLKCQKESRTTLDSICKR